MCPRRTDQDPRYSAARRPGARTGTEIHSDKRARSSKPYTADGAPSQSASRSCAPIRVISNAVCQACVVLEFDNNARRREYGFIVLGIDNWNQVGRYTPACLLTHRTRELLSPLIFRPSRVTLLTCSHLKRATWLEVCGDTEAPYRLGS